MFFGEVAHEELLDLEAAGVPPSDADEEGVGAGAAREAGGFRVEEEPARGIFEGGTSAARDAFVANAGEKLEGDGRRLERFGSGEPVLDGEVFAEAVLGYRSAEELR